MVLSSFSPLKHSSDQDDITWGVAYKIPESKVAETKAYLDHREKNGYETHFLDVFQPGSHIPVVEKVPVLADRPKSYYSLQRTLKYLTDL